MDRVVCRGGCDEDMDVGLISNPGICPSGCDEDLIGRIFEEHNRSGVWAQGKGETEYQDRPWDLSQTLIGRACRLAMSVTDGNVNEYSTSHLACSQQLGIRRAADYIIRSICMHFCLSL